MVPYFSHWNDQHSISWECEKCNAESGSDMSGGPSFIVIVEVTVSTIWIHMGLWLKGAQMAVRPCIAQQKKGHAPKVCISCPAVAAFWWNLLVWGRGAALWPLASGCLMLQTHIFHIKMNADEAFFGGKVGDSETRETICIPSIFIHFHPLLQGISVSVFFLFWIADQVCQLVPVTQWPSDPVIHFLHATDSVCLMARVAVGSRALLGCPNFQEVNAQDCCGLQGWLVPQPEDPSESIRKLSNRHNRDQNCMVWAGFSICLSFFTLLHLLQGSERKDWTNDGRFFNQWGQHPSFDQLTAALRSQLCRRTRLVTLLCIWQPVTSLGDSAEHIFGRGCEWMWMMLSVQIGVYRCTLNFDS